MKRVIATFCLGIYMSVSSFAQRETMTLTFTAVSNTEWLLLDSIMIMNRTQGGDTMLYYPDTVLVMDYVVGISEYYSDNGGFRVFQNYPNPVKDHATIELVVPEKGLVEMKVSDITGRLLFESDKILDAGRHSFRFSPMKSGTTFFTAQWKGFVKSIKILDITENNDGEVSLEYIDDSKSVPQLKAQNSLRHGFSFSPGDELLYVAYTDTLRSGIFNNPSGDQTYIFQFATNIPCPGSPTVEYEGQVYNTIQIFSQCWLKENLNAGTMIQGTTDQQNNGIIEKYCYNNFSDNCAMYGGLYQWNEIMLYSSQRQVQGICPPGWHIPGDEEWKVLFGAVDSQYSIGDTIWDESGDVGFDAGINLKTTSGWYWDGDGKDLFGFTGQPAGHRTLNGGFVLIGTASYLWSSTEVINSSSRMGCSYSSYEDNVYRHGFNKEVGYSVRCLKDN